MNFLKQKKINIKFLVLSLFLLLIMYLININSGIYFLKKLSEAIFLLITPTVVFSIITFFVNNNVFLSWIKITKYFLAISLTLILITPSSSHGLDFFPIVKETSAIFLSVLYSIFSLSFVIYKSIKLGNRSEIVNQ